MTYESHRVPVILGDGLDLIILLIISYYVSCTLTVTENRIQYTGHYQLKSERAQSNLI